MLRIGLTGGIGTGKSAASKILEELGAYICDADKESKKILLSNETIKSELISEFGTDIMRGDGNVDNNKLARVAFQDQDHQLRLNTIVHPYVFDLPDKRKILSYKKLYSRYKIPKNYFFIPNQFWKHKNHNVIVETLKYLKENKDKDIYIVLTGFPHDHRHKNYFEEYVISGK